ncbi:hypothetical protein JQ607_18200 [Bradyrhizobium liaoningense]|uniref:hypothetical protein n=1 Tax=Bradyrhizobium liaoningense TaxID=43992 RepID=UPI001BAE059F|nr:hypothetical protein [Bradyrhizobium liaoningense]MBR0842135.1 hypothetical protein [Bradyrhizobium liaoningense]MBR0858113.1 hypothetical protein [Bradyrhizobium liaoningense]
MADIVRLVPKAELERLRLIREARAIYDSIFPPTALIGEQPHGCPAQSTQGASDWISLENSALEGER